MLIQLLYFQMALAFKKGRAISVTRIQGSPAKLFTCINSVFPAFRLAETLKAPSVRNPSKATSCHASGTAGKTLILPPQLCNNISCIDCAPDNGVSITGPDSLYNVFTLKNVQTAYSNKPMHHSLFPVQMRWKKLRSMNNPDELLSSIARNEEISQ